MQFKKKQVFSDFIYITYLIFKFFKNKFFFIAFKWPQEATVLLIEEYRSRQNDFISGKMSQKKIWLLIAAKMLKHGYKVSGAQCLSKFSGLKRTYKAVKDYNKRYGSGSRTWTFFPVSYFKIKML